MVIMLEVRTIRKKGKIDEKSRSRNWPEYLRINWERGSPLSLK